MPMPIRIKPIWDTEEQASVRFRFTENKASSAPCKHSQDAQEQNERTPSHIKLQRLQLTTRTPKIPALVRIPESSAGSRRRSYRMGLGKPDVKREYTDLGAEAKQQTGCPDKRFR